MPSSEFNSSYSTLEIPSPGIPPSHPNIKKAKNLISEYDFFSDIMPKSIWISGTNGKTTTTQMITHLLKDKNAISGGNIGTPLGEMDKNATFWILETSSFTLHYTNRAKPDIYILLPIKPDHISWHGSFEEYEKAKLKPILKMKEGEVAIIPKKYENIQTDGFVITYENQNDLAKYFDIDTSKIKFKGAFLLDALLAMAVKKILFDITDYEAINSFVIEPHRQEEFKDKNNLLWVNDTKATNIDATLSCVDVYKDRFIHLILGGDDKGVELDELFEYLKDKNIKTYHIGSNKDRLSNKAKEYGIEYILCKNLEDAVIKIKQNLKENEVAILSPAAASLDEFNSYAHRGEEFKRFVNIY
jgi:UDP-N-acetylmuramoylalanine--D-glutamate ligase